MQRSGFRPDVVSYALLINAYGKERRDEEALAVFEEMVDAGVRYSMTSVIYAYIIEISMLFVYSQHQTRILD